jgi:2-methylcitrate dehydratase PrpD
MGVGLSDAISAHVAAAAFERLPAATVAAAKRVLLDAYGVMLAASGMAEEVRPFLAVARRAGPGPCAIVGAGERVTLPMAALANGALTHALDYEDAFDRAPGHPNASLVPALIALAQSGGPVDGQRFLTALAVGGDLACRVALALRQPMEAGGWYPPPITAGIGAAAGAANLLGLDAARTRDALSLMLCQATMPGEIKHSPGTVIRAVREAFPAQAAVTSVLLAREGVAGFEQPLEGRAGFYALFAEGRFDARDLTDALGDRFWIEELTFKPWPSCRGTHPFIELAFGLKRSAGIAAGDIAAITAEVDEVQRMLVEPAERKRAPASAIDAKFSIPFCIALALVRGRVGLDDFGAESRRDPALLAVAERARALVVDMPGRMRGSGGGLCIALVDGRELRAEIADALGGPQRPLSDAELVDKFVDCAGRSARPLDPARARGFAGRILALEHVADVGALLAQDG